MWANQPEKTNPRAANPQLEERRNIRNQKKQRTSAAGSETWRFHLVPFMECDLLSTSSLSSSEVDGT